ncbi:MAG: biopolymer transporter ExbD [Candidatus Eisenbacteria bacterium]|uniref:Biopolymer transporter ExbD n=1 Tax=Eiseniibacteriota bacterium TaxID=2212470 RepID=A0A956RN03_UNCEI|nr:biopolymer transporter ExbD [Candidatus Eisenbacteria bacterium]
MRNRRWGRRARKSGPAQLKLTSMMDILTVLLLFLVKSFVVDTPVTPVPGVTLPESTSKETPEESFVIAITGPDILVDGERVSSVDEATAGSGLFIASLGEHLATIRTHKQELARMRGLEEEAGLGPVTVQGDRAIEYRVLERVLYTLGQEGFSEISLAVIREA